MPRLHKRVAFEPAIAGCRVRRQGLRASGPCFVHTPERGMQIGDVPSRLPCDCRSPVSGARASARSNCNNASSVVTDDMFHSARELTAVAL